MSKEQEKSYIPDYLLRDGKPRVLRDYGMIVKIDSLNLEARAVGKKMLMVAGCHGAGTIAAARAVGEAEILREIWNKVRDRNFQAILMCDTKSEQVEQQVLDIPSGVQLLEVVPLG